MSDNNAPKLTALEKLKAREAKLKAQIKSEKAKAARKEAALQKRKSAIVGEAVLAEMEDNPDFSDIVRAVLKERITQPKDRKMLQLDAKDFVMVTNTDAPKSEPQEEEKIVDDIPV